MGAKVFPFVRDFLFPFRYKLGMELKLVCQGRQVRGEELDWLRQWIAEHRQWSRKRLARELCHEWDWRNERGQIKDFAARAFLEKLATRGLLMLPVLQLQRSHPRPKPTGPVPINWPTDPISEPLRELAPVQWTLPLAGTPEAKRFEAYVQRYHYLGLRVVGQNLKYLVRDKPGRDLATSYIAVQVREQGAGMLPVCKRTPAENGAGGLASARSADLLKRCSAHKRSGVPGFYLLLVPRSVLERLLEDSGDDSL